MPEKGRFQVFYNLTTRRNVSINTLLSFITFRIILQRDILNNAPCRIIVDAGFVIVKKSTDHIHSTVILFSL